MMASFPGISARVALNLDDQMQEIVAAVGVVTFVADSLARQSSR